MTSSAPDPTALTLVLASGSPARLKTLRSAGIEPQVQVRLARRPRGGRPRAYGELDADQVALLLARAKAEDVASTRDDGLVLGCDSVLELYGELDGKPLDAAEATARWQRMRGGSASCPGHWLIDLRDTEDGGSGATLGAVASTTVHFADVTDEEITAYVATGEPLEVAGAFTTDGLGGAFVRGIRATTTRSLA